jgi:hypothetical protein
MLCANSIYFLDNPRKTCSVNGYPKQEKEAYCQLICMWRLLSSGMWRHVVFLMFTDSSDERAVSTNLERSPTLLDNIAVMLINADSVHKQPYFNSVNVLGVMLVDTQDKQCSTFTGSRPHCKEINNFLGSIKTGDESWVHHSQPENWAN